MINQLRRDVRAKHYKPLILLITLDFLDKQKLFSPIIPTKIIVEKFEIIMKKIGYNREHNKGWMPFCICLVTIYGTYIQLTIKL